MTVVVGTSTAPSVWAASSADKKKVDSQISQLRGELTEVSAEEAELLGKMDELNNRKADLDAQSADLQSKMEQAQRELQEATQRLVTIQAQVDAAQAKLEATQAALTLSTQRMREQAVAAYMGSEVNTDLTDFVLHANDMREVTAANEYLSQVVRDKRQIVEEHRELEGQANDAKLALDKVRKQAEADRQVIQQRTQDLVNQQAELQAVQAGLVQQASDQAALLAEVESKRASIQAQIDAMQRQSESIAAQLRQANPPSSGGSATPPPAGKGIIANPVPGAPLTSKFGMRNNPVTGRYVLHAGQDFGVKVGTPIHAGADGTVVVLQTTGQSGGYGNYSCIAHAGGLATCYAHQSQFMVSSGQRVSRNQVIGLTGNTGNSTGPHLHFEVRLNGTPVDPVNYM
jgi:murein DD-endopeptidase MepM/ murein hydrolase activator NlpD